MRYLLILPFLSSLIAYSQSTLSECPSENSTRTWNNCIGAIRVSSGDTYKGEFRDGKPNGRGTFHFLADNQFKGDRYEGELRGGEANSRGVYIHANGNRYEGEFREGKRNGFGSYHVTNGKVMTGFWSENRYIGEKPPTHDPLIPKSRIRMTSIAGVFTVPVRLNEQFNLNFTVDSGATDVTVPADVVLTLFRTNTIAMSDFRGEQAYALADGSTFKSRKFVLRKLTVGDHTVENVEALIVDIKGQMLLGQSFLKRFKSWSIDNTTHELVLH